MKTGAPREHQPWWRWHDLWEYRLKNGFHLPEGGTAALRKAGVWRTDEDTVRSQTGLRTVPARAGIGCSTSPSGRAIHSLGNGFLVAQAPRSKKGLDVGVEGGRGLHP